MTITIQYLMILVAIVEIPNQIIIATFRKMFEICQSDLSYKENLIMPLHISPVFVN